MSQPRVAADEVFIPEICLLILQTVGGMESLRMRCVSKSWLEASHHIRIEQSFYNNYSRFFKIIDHPMMEHVDTLLMNDCQLQKKDYEQFVTVPHLKNLTCLHLNHEDEMGELLEVNLQKKIRNDVTLIANSSVFRNLEKLSLCNEGIGDDGLLAIFNSSVLSNLQVLELKENCFTKFGDLTINTNQLINLTELHFENEHISKHDLQLICNNQLFSNLRALRITATHSISSLDALDIILTSKVLSKLTRLESQLLVVDKRVATIKSTVNHLEKLVLRVNNSENCKLLMNNRSICGPSLKYLNIGCIVSTDSVSFQELDKLGEQFEEFKYTFDKKR